MTTPSLTRTYVTALVLYFALMGAFWAVGFEGIYGHPTPFYALWFPAVDLSLAALFRHSLVALVAGLFLAWAGRVLPKALGEHGLTPMQRRRFLMALVLFGIAFPCAVAMLRGGTDGIAQAYARQAYEYAGDIGKARSIPDLFARYLELRPHLSMHAKVHPPGPIAFLWLLSYAVTQDALMLSLATIAVAALAVIPLYAWANALLGPQAAALAALLYACVPSVVLFNATSADALFPPVTLLGLFCFDRALRAGPLHRVAGYAILAGLLFGAMSILKFSLIGLGAYFAFMGTLLLFRAETRRNVFVVAAVMFTAFLAFHLALRAATGYDVIGNFLAAKAQFDEDQFHLDQLTPRLAPWIYRLLNPLCWSYFAGIPVSLMFYWRLRRPDPATRPLFLVFLLTALALNLLYLARGEGERSALYLFPFLVLPAAHWLAQRHGAVRPALLFLLFQCWLTEVLFYTYW